MLADGIRALSRRGGGGAGRRRAPTSLAIRDDGGADRLDAASRRCSASTPPWRPARRCCRPTSRGNLLLEGRRRSAAMSTAPSPTAPRWPRACSRPPSSSTPISSRRPAGRGAWATASRSMSRRRRPTWIATRSRNRPAAAARGGAHRADRLRRRFRRQARPVGAAADRRWRPGSSDGPCACVYTRPESMAATTKRHPARVARAVRLRCRGQARRPATSTRDFNTGAYASWGRPWPTACRCMPWGPTRVPNVRDLGRRAILTNGPPAGAFRGFGVPQAAIAHEAMMDELAEKLGIDRLEFRHRNALAGRRHDGDRPGAGALAPASPQCLEALRPHWQRGAGSESRPSMPATAARSRRGVGIGCMWYGFGNTSMSNPRRMRIGLSPAGTLTLYSGAVDIGQGSTTIMLQIAADALGLPVAAVRAGRRATPTSRPTPARPRPRARPSSRARRRRWPALDLRQQILRLANAGPEGTPVARRRRSCTMRDGDAVRDDRSRAMPAQGPS